MYEKKVRNNMILISFFTLKQNKGINVRTE